MDRMRFANEASSPDLSSVYGSDLRVEDRAATRSENVLPSSLQRIERVREHVRCEGVPV